MQQPRTTQQNAIDLAILAEIFEEAPAFMAILSGPKHVFEMTNKAYNQLVGHRDILGKPVLTALPEVSGQGFIELLDGVRQTGNPFIGKGMKVQLQLLPNTRLEERYVDFVYQARRNAEGEIVGIFAHGVDVTEMVVARQLSEARAQHVKQQAQTFDSALNNITDFVYTFDRMGRFTYSNKPLLDLLDISLEDIIGKNFHQLPYTPELATTLLAHIHHVVATGTQVLDETPFISPSGKEGYYEYIFTPVFGDDGQVAVVAGSTRDITERVRQERQKDEFLAIVSHELKTPVTSIKAYTQVLKKRLAKEGNARAEAHLAKMDAQINKLIALIGDLLDVTKINSGQLQFHTSSFAFDEVVAEAIEEVQRTTEQHRITSIGATQRMITGDRDRIGQVLTNLLTNAIKYSPEADTVLVTAAADEQSITLAVQDFGMGISAEQLPHVFERFYRAPEEHQETVPGLGLGLYIAAEIVQRHGGTLTVESVLGEGTTFRCTLPIQPCTPADTQSPTPSREDVPHE